MLRASRLSHLLLRGGFGGRCRTMSDKKKVCVAVDNSPSSAEALKWATSTLVQPDDEVIIVNVVAPTAAFPSPTADPAVPWLEPSSESLEEASQMLQSLAQQAQKLGVKHVRTSVVEAPVGGAEGVGITLKDYARREAPDMVVMGSRGLGSFSRAVLGVLGLGSVSSFCTRELPCPVLVHKGHGAGARVGGGEPAGPAGGTGGQGQAAGQ